MFTHDQSLFLLIYPLIISFKLRAEGRNDVLHRLTSFVLALQAKDD